FALLLALAPGALAGGFGGFTFIAPANPAGPSPVAGIAVISSPVAGAHLKGDVAVTGEADWPNAPAPWNFQTYALEWGQGANPTSFTTIASGGPADSATNLGTWSTGALPDGPYVLRLSSVNNTGNYVRAIVPVIVDNSGSWSGASFPVSDPTPQPRGSGPSAIMLNSSSYTDPASGWLHIVGEVQNNGNANLQLVEVTATFKDASGNPLQTAIAFAVLPILVPGQTSPFDLFTRPPANAAGSAALAVTYSLAAGPPAPGLAVSEAQIQTDDQGNLHLMGVVTNSAATTNTSYHVAYALHDTSGTTIRAGSFNTVTGQNGAAFSLAPGTSGRFDFTIPNSPPTFGSYTLSVQ
ncbi:MAG: FxLYD domain-containing protein, partial [Chloroflexota bacterium]